MVNNYSINPLRKKLLKEGNHASLNLFFYIEMCRMVEDATQMNFDVIAISLKKYFNICYLTFSRMNMSDIIKRMSNELNLTICNCIDMDEHFNDGVNNIFTQVINMQSTHRYDNQDDSFEEIFFTGYLKMSS